MHTREGALDRRVGLRAVGIDIRIIQTHSGSSMILLHHYTDLSYGVQRAVLSQDCHYQRFFPPLYFGFQGRIGLGCMAFQQALWYLRHFQSP